MGGAFFFCQGVKPASLAKVTDPDVRAFIEKCIAKVPDRLPAKELLNDPFLWSDEESETIGCSMKPKTYNSGKYEEFLGLERF